MKVPSPTAMQDDGNTAVYYAKPPVDDAKTLSLTSGDGGGGGDASSATGTSTALLMDASSDEMVYEKIVSEITGILVNIEFRQLEIYAPIIQYNHHYRSLN